MKANHRRCYGIDVHKNSVTVCVLPAADGDRETEVSCVYRDLKQLRAAWRTAEGELRAGLLGSGKLRNSWVPPRPLRELRDLTRQRVNVLEDLNRAKNRTEQLCQTGNIKSKCLR